ncbi:unnamed protein product [Symbiodinium sp. CCMP2592]|nr:unnamed protein product [Symbiodinium sp. CCMP2592]
MVGRRVEQSRLSVAVALVMVVLCFWLPATNRYQALAIPASNKKDAIRTELGLMTVVKLKEKLRKRGLILSGKKSALVERLMTSMLTEISSTAAGKRKLPGADPADCATDVFIPLDGTVQILEQTLEDKRVVFLRAGVASGKSTLAQYLCTKQPNKYLQVHAPLHTDLTFENWLREFRKAVGAEDIMEAIKSIYEQDQVLVFDECHLLFACPKFYEMLTKTPTYLKQRLMVLLLSAASEAETVQGQIRLTPGEITDKFMWTPPMPNASVLASELSEAGVRLTKDAIKFFFQICGGHRGIFMRAMAWVLEKQRQQRGACAQWTVEQAYGEVKLAWADEDWSIPNSFLGWLAGTRAIRVNGHYANLANIPQQMLEILCSGATSNLDPELRRNLTVHGFLLPVAESNADEFVQYDWSAAGARYGVSTHLLASYYRCVLKKTRNLEVDVSLEVSSGTDLLLRALPYLHFAQVVGGVILQDSQVQSIFSKRGAPFEVHYTTAINQILQRLGFSAGSVEDGNEGKVDVYVVLADRATIALEAVMVSRSPKEVDSRRGRFDNASLKNYHNATRKCLVIIGGWEERDAVKRRVQSTRGGIEIVGLAANGAHTGYNVYIKRQVDNNIDTVVDFYIPCDGVARSFAFKDEEPVFEISSAQKLKSINPGTTSSSVVWVRELARNQDGTITAKSRQDPEGEDELEPAFKVESPQDYPRLNDVDHLKKAIKQTKSNALRDVDHDQIDIYLYSKEAGAWRRIKDESEVLRRDTTRLDCYGFLPWQRT